MLELGVMEELRQLQEPSNAVQSLRFPSGLEVWHVGGAREAREAMLDDRFSHALRNLQRAGILGFDHALGASLLTSDDPQHARLRRLVSGAFSQRRVRRLQPHIAAVVERLLTDIARDEVVDIFARLAEPLATTIICDLIGIPEGDRHLMRTWSRTLVTTATTKAEHDARRAALAAQRDYWTSAIDGFAPTSELATGPDREPSLAAVLIEAHRRGHASRREVAALLNLLVVAGLENTAILIGNGLLALLAHPVDLRALRADPTRVEDAVEELLRFVGPVQRSDLRVARESVRVGDVDIPAGAAVTIAIAAANRDEREYPEPDRLDVCRPRVQHLAFGYGPHRCLGATLARAEAATAIRRVLERFPNLSLARDERSDARARQRGLFVHGVDSLLVRPHGLTWAGRR